MSIEDKLDSLIEKSNEILKVLAEVTEDCEDDDDLAQEVYDSVYNPRISSDLSRLEAVCDELEEAMFWMFDHISEEHAVEATKMWPWLLTGPPQRFYGGNDNDSNEQNNGQKPK